MRERQRHDPVAPPPGPLPSWGSAPAPRLGRPFRPERLLFFAFGPLFAFATYLLGQWLIRATRDGIVLRMAILSNFVAGAMMSAMAVVQESLFADMGERVRGAETVAQATTWREIATGVNTVQIGLDVVWDLWVTLGGILMGLALLTRLRLRPWIGVLGIAVSAATLAVNLYYFPHPPVDQGGIDLGPAVAAWYGLVMGLVVWHVASPPGRSSGHGLAG